LRFSNTKAFERENQNPRYSMRVLATIQRFAETGEGDVKELKGQSGELRCKSATIVRFTDKADHTIRIHAVRHRRKAYW